MPRIALSQILCLTITLLLLVHVAEARRLRRPTIDWGLDASLANVYNSNILGMSPSDRHSFLSNPNAFPTPLKSVDDLESEVQIHPVIHWRAPLNLMLGADYRLKLVHRLRNSFTDYQSHTLALTARPRVTGYNWSTRFRILGIPSYYLRVYRDRDYNQWHAARYANYDYELSGRLRWWGSLWSEAGVGYGTYYYNSKFTEYDTEYRYASFASGYEFGPDWSASGSYTRRIAANIGKDQPGVFNTPPADPSLLGDTEYGNSDANEDDWSVQVTWRLHRWTSLPIETNVSYRLRRRVYTTERSLLLDPFHRGRLDRRHLFTVSVDITAVPRFTIEPYFTYDQRIADSPVPNVPLVKDFVRREFGLTLGYRIR